VLPLRSNTVLEQVVVTTRGKEPWKGKIVINTEKIFNGIDGDELTKARGPDS